jgi:hydrogenase maturation protein HypF
MRTDDSVARVVGKETYPTRRSRGYAPSPLRLAEDFRRHVLACGGELKNTFCVGKGGHVFISHHIGDLENFETLTSFRDGIDHFCRLFDVRPELVAYDLHPEYLSTKYARELEESGLAAVGVQHHHAHVASCLADNGRPGDERVIGVALDGTGYGTDGAVWGGEFFEGSLESGFERRGHLEYAPLPGGSAAIRQPWRMALAQLVSIYGEDEAAELPLAVVRQAGERNTRLITRLIEHGLNTPPTSSAGRLFDAVAALVGVPGTERTTYEGQAAVELELAAEEPANRGYPFRLRAHNDGWVVETHGIIRGVVDDLLYGRRTGEISSRFHSTMAEVVAAGCERTREAGGPATVALSGGTFQNMLLLDQTIKLLEEKEFMVHKHKRVPANDGGIALGQAVLADRTFTQADS